MDLLPLLLTFKLAVVTTLILILVGIPLAYWLAFGKSRVRAVIEPLVSMPLVLPPTVLGFYLLLFFSPSSAFGHFLDSLGLHIAFTFTGLVIGSFLYSLPFMVNPIKAAFEAFPRTLMEASWALGKSPRETFFKIILPNIKPAVWTAVAMAFAHTVGEFGVVLMIGGNIPGVTQVASIAVFTEVQALNYQAAALYSAILFISSFLILFFVSRIHKNHAHGLTRL
jgi:molybdate transport system permease protein